jgi:curved DNA-binding protein CbpA
VRAAPQAPPVAAPARPAAPPAPAPAPAAARPAAAPAPARRPGVDVAARRAEVERLVQVIDKQNYFEILGVPQDVPDAKIQAAYFEAAKTWHPDRQPAELADVKPQIARIFARISEAYQTLSDPAKRAEYAKSVAQGGGTADEKEKVARIVDAAMEFQKADILLRKGDLVAAEALATRAVQADPGQPEYMAVLAWIHFQRRPAPPGFQEGQYSDHWDDLIRLYDSVLAKEPRYERGLYYRGMILKRSGRPDKAIADFKLAAELNPRNTDAVREVRLHQMRAGQAKPAGAPQPSRGQDAGKKDAGKKDEGGLLGRLFKK